MLEENHIPERRNPTLTQWPFVLLSIFIGDFDEK